MTVKEAIAFLQTIPEEYREYALVLVDSSSGKGFDDVFLNHRTFEDKKEVWIEIDVI